jgi:hypothetical protein
VLAFALRPHEVVSWIGEGVPTLCVPPQSGTPGADLRATVGTSSPHFHDPVGSLAMPVRIRTSSLSVAVTPTTASNSPRGARVRVLHLDVKSSMNEVFSPEQHFDGSGGDCHLSLTSGDHLLEMLPRSDVRESCVAKLPVKHHRDGRRPGVSFSCGDEMTSVLGAQRLSSRTLVGILGHTRGLVQYETGRPVECEDLSFAASRLTSQNPRTG